jgi:glycosyltransferase involved in cell wall biosynthesis
MTFAACIPVYNNAATLAAAIAGVRAQTTPAGEILVVDDGSTDDSARVAREAGARVVRGEANRGRGWARATAVRECAAEWILFVDGGNALEADFVTAAQALLAEENLAGVVGCWHDPAARTRADRWRARHLFKTGEPHAHGEARSLATHACLVRRAAVLAAGNFNEELRQYEDAELGARLARAGWRVRFGAESRVRPLRPDGWGKLAVRYTRWYAGSGESLTLKTYLKWVSYSARVMAREDLRAGDWGAVPFTLALPHWMAWTTRKGGGR